MEGQELLTHSLCTENAGARPVGCQFTFETQHENSQDGLSLEFVSATVVGSAIFRMQGVEGCEQELEWELKKTQPHISDRLCEPKKAPISTSMS